MSAKGVLITIGVVFVVGLFFVFGIRAGSISRDVACEKASGEIENQNQRRFDLVPQLVSTVDAALSHESNTHRKVVEARNGLLAVQEAIEQAKQAGDRDKINELADKSLDVSKKLIAATFENYPQLRANENLLGLQSQLEGTENRLSQARRDYNEAVGKFRNYSQQWGFMPYVQPADKWRMFKAQEGAKERPKIEFPSQGRG